MKACEPLYLWHLAAEDLVDDATGPAYACDPSDLEAYWLSCTWWSACLALCPLDSKVTSNVT